MNMSHMIEYSVSVDLIKIT